MAALRAPSDERLAGGGVLAGHMRMCYCGKARRKYSSVLQVTDNSPGDIAGRDLISPYNLLSFVHLRLQ